jgi:hypothetical protein
MKENPRQDHRFVVVHFANSNNVSISVEKFPPVSVEKFPQGLLG